MTSDRREIISKIVNGDADELLKWARALVKANANPQPRGHHVRKSGSRKGYNQARMTEYRKVQSKITADDLADELRKQLFPGVKDGQTAADRLEAYNIEKAIPMCVTTRAIGFGTCSIFSVIYEFNNVPLRGSIYQMYRVCLAVFECKVQVTQRGVTAIMENEEDYRPLRMNCDAVTQCKGVVVLPDHISSVVNSVGQLKVFDRKYVPKLGRDNFTDGRFIPQAEQVCYSNLRRTVEALSDRATPVVYRRRFYNNCPLPGAIWDGGPRNPILLNADEIMPPGYTNDDLADDIVDIKSKMNFLARKAPKYFTKAISYESEGGKPLLVCNEQQNLRIADRQNGERLEDYYARMKLEGDIDEFFNLEHLTTGEQLEGNLCLLGETPTTKALIYPIYVMRNKRAAVEFSKKISRTSKF